MRKRLFGVMATVLIVLSGCSGSLTHSQDIFQKESQSSHEDKAADYDSALAKFYEQKVSWNNCGKDECAEVEVPLDYKNPEGKIITIAMKKTPATKKEDKQGTIFLNPGGPGGSGIDMLKMAREYLGSSVMRVFDVIGFDPRGVGKSTAVKCFPDDETKAKYIDTTIPDNTPQYEEKIQNLQKEIADLCEQYSGDLLPFVGTDSAAKDLDILRHLAGDSRLNYLGFSYGTYLGAQYADLFPKHVGRLVLDGAVDSSMGSARMVVEQSHAFEVAAKRFVEWCQQNLANSCPVKGSVEEGLKDMRKIIDDASAKPMQSDYSSIPFTGEQALSALTLPLYSKQMWSTLAKALNEYERSGNVSTLQMVAFIAQDRQQDGKFTSNMTEANWAINCADYPPMTKEEIAKASAETKDGLLFHDDYASSDMCAVWPYKVSKKRGPFKAKGSPTILVIGTKYDPATPYSWSKALASHLENTRLITYEGDGHTAFGGPSNCVNQPVREFFKKGKVPEEDVTCPAK
ncbi:alpha/beta hydrolase [Actinotignum urinale]|uniref:alpha/beta hydrolase n=1 Tax=Actinotignum urinale TaxID=190146 RepID=UPI002A825813|nr:alpha/beta hydrolase [Actinotignum urinale]MDY5151773.1 alpha/beta hydrolase [Actinotignum urinale]